MTPTATDDEFEYRLKLFLNPFIYLFVALIILDMPFWLKAIGGNIFFACGLIAHGEMEMFYPRIFGVKA